MTGLDSLCVLCGVWGVVYDVSIESVLDAGAGMIVDGWCYARLFAHLHS